MSYDEFAAERADNLSRMLGNLCECVEEHGLAYLMDDELKDWWSFAKAVRAERKRRKVVDDAMRATLAEIVAKLEPAELAIVEARRGKLRQK